MGKLNYSAALALVGLMVATEGRAEVADPSILTGLEALGEQADVQQATISDDGHSVRILRGRLTSASRDPVEQIVYRFLTDQGHLVGVYDTASLAPGAPRRLGASTVLRFRQIFEGAPVAGAHLTALVDAEGRLRFVAQSLASAEVVGEVLVDAAEAAEIAAPEVIRPSRQPAPEQAMLVYLPVGMGLRPAYAVYFGRVPALLSNWHALVDATTGELITRYNAVQYERTALAWQESPATGDLESVSLETLELEGQDCIAEGALPALGPHGEPAPDDSVARLCTPRISARNCWDHHEAISVNLPLLGATDLHSCTEYHMAVPNDAPAGQERPDDDDLDNDFYYEDADGALDYSYADDPNAGQDLFAEVHALYHTERAYGYFRAFDPSLFTMLREGQLLVSTNWRIPIDINSFGAGAGIVEIMEALTLAQDLTGPLFAFDNAMYLPSGNLFGIIERPQSSLLFFQGNARDFAYDAGVIYHELTHAIVGTVVDGIGLGVTRRDSQGMHLQSLSMNEAYADFFATVMTGDAVMGEYALEGAGRSATRDLASRPRHNCPERLINEEHWDSAPYSEALWELHEALDPAATEHAIFVALCLLTPSSSYDEGAAATVAAIESEVGSEAAATAREIFARYGYDDQSVCRRVVELPAGEDVDQLTLSSTQLEIGTISPYAPAVVQFRIEVPTGTRQLIVRFSSQAALTDLLSLFGGGEPTPGLLVRQGSEPIEFSVTGEVTSTADTFIPRAEADPRFTGGQRFVHHLDGEELTAGPYHLMFVNSGTGGGSVGRIWYETSEEAPDLPEADGDVDGDRDGDGDTDGDLGDDGGDADADGDGDGDADPGEDAAPAVSTRGGACDCTVTDGAPLPFLVRPLVSL